MKMATRIKKRNEKIRKFRNRFPELEQKAIARIFHISEATVSRALRG